MSIKWIPAFGDIALIHYDGYQSIKDFWQFCIIVLDNHDAICHKHLRSLPKLICGAASAAILRIKSTIHFCAFAQFLYLHYKTYDDCALLLNAGYKDSYGDNPTWKTPMNIFKDTKRLKLVGKKNVNIKLADHTRYVY